MNRNIASILIIFILSMHSAWAINSSVSFNHILNSDSHLSADHRQVIDNTTSEDCEKHGCHISAHATGMFSVFNLILSNSEQSLNITLKLSEYFYSQTIPQRPPKV